MKVPHMMIQTILASLLAFLSLFLLTGCINRLQDYEPYSTFDERMAAAEQGRPMPTDEQMPTEIDNQYVNDSGGEAMWADQPQPNYQPHYAGGGGGRRSSSSSGSGATQSDLEVPFDNSRGPKHAANIGAL